MKKIVSFALVLLMLFSFAACGSGGETKTYTFTLMFLADGKIIQRANYSVGDTISAPVTVVKEGYTFVGWAEEVPQKMPARDLYINAVFEKNSYKVSYYVNDILVHEDSVPFGDKIPAYTAEEAYEWDAELPETMPAHDIALHCSVASDTHLLTFTVNGKTYKAEVYRVGEKIAVPDAPKADGYAFEGWDGLPETMPAHDVTVVAIMKADTYKLSYYSADGGYLLNSIDVECGRAMDTLPPIIPVSPEGKVFAGWSNMPETMPAHDVSVYPIWEDANEEYTVNYYVSGTLYATQKYNPGSVVTAPENPTGVEGFAGWRDLPETMPAHDVTVEAIITTPYLLAFYTDEDTLYMSMQIPEGTPLSVFIPKAPQKDGYVFVQWDVEIPDVMPGGDLKITAVWEKAGYSLEFYDGDPANGGQLIKKDSINAGNAVVYPEIDQREGYNFVGWSEDITVMPESDLVVYAIWGLNIYKLTYVSSLDEQITVEYGFGEPVSPLVPADHYGYKFDGWVGIPVTMPAHDVTVVAVWTEVEPEPVNVTVDLAALESGETYTIIAGGVYTLSGIAANAKIVINSEYDVTLKLKNAYLTCESGNAIECVSATSLTIQALTSSVNLITTKDGGIVSNADLSIIGNGNITFTTKDGIKSKGNIVFDANNSYLTITSNGVGIYADGDIFVASGRLDIEAADEAIKADKGYTMDSGEVIANSSGKLSVSATESITVNGGKLMVSSAGNGISASSVALNGGFTEVTADGTGIVSTSSISLSDTELTVYSEGVGVYAYTTFESVNSKIYAISGGSAVLSPSYDANGNRIPTTAITANSVTITGGRVEATSTQYAFDTFLIRIRNAVVKLTTSEDAVFVGGDASFTECDMQIRAGLSFKNDTSPLTRSGINVAGDLVFTGGSIDIKSADECILAKSISAMGTEFTLDTDMAAVSVSESATFGACNVEIKNCKNGIVAGSVEFKSTDAEITAEQNAIKTSKDLLVSGGEIRLCANDSAVIVGGDLGMTGGLLLAFSKSAELPALVCFGSKTVTTGIIAAFDMSGNNYTGNGFYCAMPDTVKQGTLVRIAGDDFALTLYPAYSFRSVLVLSGDMIVGNTYTVITGGKYVGSETYNVLTGGTYTPGTPVISSTYKA